MLPLVTTGYITARDRFIVSVILLIFFLFYIHANPVIPENDNSATSTAKQTVASTDSVVKRVIDGDTIELDNGQKVRYIGMNTPESVDPRRAVECFGTEASAYNKNLVLGKKVSLVADVGNTDKYGRLLRYVYLEDGTFVNMKLVADGYASVMTVPPNVAHQQDFIQAERDARAAKRGLWSACK